jgi:hypothetical protein
MTKRDFLILMIKLFGLSSAVTTIFSVLPNNVAFSFHYIDFSVVIWLGVVSIATVGLFWLLTFKADKLVDVLKLDKGFADERIELGDMKTDDIIKTGIFIIGGLLFIENVPGLLSQVFWAFKGEVVGLDFKAKEKFDLGISGLNVLLGFLLVTNYDRLARRLNKISEEE